MPDKVLVIGSGGREHTLAWKLAQSDQVESVLVSPGNAGTHESGKIKNTDVNIKDFDVLAKWCKDNQINMVLVGPEDPLANGIADSLKNAGIPCFGPSAQAAQIEASKAFAKAFMDKYKIPTARWKSFTDAEEACSHIKSVDYDALVVKASGLAAGKGVIVAKNVEEACEAVQQILKDKAFGAAGETVVIEELLEGEEVSCLAFSDGENVACMPPAQDHKRLLDGDQGLNTGGMGAYCPCPLVNEEEIDFIKKEVLEKAVQGMKKDGTPYVGVLYAGLMLTKNGPKVLEYNCRFGDPETQVLLPLLKSDLYEIAKKCVAGELGSITPEFHDDRSAVAVVTVSGGYPGSYKKGFEIKGIDKVKNEMNQLVFHAGTALKDECVVTSGGRVLAVVAMDSDLKTATQNAQQGAAAIEYSGVFFRKDIGHKAIRKCGGLSYKDSGVDVSAGDDLVQQIKPLAAATKRSGCVSEIGAFGAMFDVKAAGYTDPLLVSGTDGVGTKLKLAHTCGIHNTVGQDLVAMCVNDILAHGAEPLFFLDYFACGKLDVVAAKDVVKGIADGCSVAGCALIGGETAEMPSMYQAGEYDLAGFAVGAVERDQCLPKSNISEGDVLIGIGSSGVHSNGFSLVRKIVENCAYDYNMPCPFDKEKSLGESLLMPTKIYCKSVLPLMKEGLVKAMAHITGGGFYGNLPRILPDDLAVTLNATEWKIPPVFGWISNKGNVEADEMASTFNCGVGAVLVIAKEDEEKVLKKLKDIETAWKIGSVCKQESKEKRVVINDLNEAITRSFQAPAKTKAENQLNGAVDKKQRTNGEQTKMKVGVLISGSGTNLQALIDHTKNPSAHSPAEIVLVISNVAGVQGLKRAMAAGIPTKVISHKGYKNREEYDDVVYAALQEAGVELVCLAGFMRILSGKFVQNWRGHLLNIHPSLLPSFKGMNAHKLVLEAGVCISGCTVHFVAEEVDAGAILVQESVPVYPDDTEESLSTRVKTVEHKAYPRALDLVAGQKVTLLESGKLEWNL